MGLAVAVDAPVALLEAVGIEGQLQVDQVMAPRLKVQALGRRVGADEDEAVGRAEARRDLAARGVVVLAVDREDLPTPAAIRARAAARWLSTYSV